jgi:hypothetical protein
MIEQERNLLIEKHMFDLKKLFPIQLLISKKQLSKLRKNSESTVNREKGNGTGIPYKKEGEGMVMYPLRDIAAWMADTSYAMMDIQQLINKHIADIAELFPGQLLISKSQLAQLRGISESTLNREKSRGEGILFKDEGGRIMYPVRSIAEWLCKTTKTMG